MFPNVPPVTFGRDLTDVAQVTLYRGRVGFYLVVMLPGTILYLCLTGPSSLLCSQYRHLLILPLPFDPPLLLYSLSHHVFLHRVGPLQYGHKLPLHGSADHVGVLEFHGAKNHTSALSS